MTLKRWLPTWLVLTSLAFTPVASAADSAKVRAKALFRLGSEHYQAGKYREALKAFEQAYAIKPLPLMLFNIALCHEGMHRLPQALEVFDKFVASQPADTSEARAKIAQIRKILATEWSTLDLTTEPPGATVWVGSKEDPPRGTTPLEVRLPSGRQTLLLEKAGFQPVKRTLKIEGGKTTPLSIVLPAVLPMISVRTTPSGARVSFDGALAGTTPLSHGVKAGKHTMRVELGGYGAVEQPVSLRKSHTAINPLVVDVVLEKLAEVGRLRLEVDRAGLEVKIDGQVIGKTPLTEPITLSVGMHAIEVATGGEAPYREMANIEPNQVTRTLINLAGPGGGDAPGEGMSGKTWGLIVMGTGGAALAAGAIFGVLTVGASGDLDDCRADSSCEFTQEEADLATDVRGKALLADILVLTGIAVAGGGAAIYLLSGDDAAPAPAKSTQAGISYSWGAVPTRGGVAAFGRVEF